MTILLSFSESSFFFMILSAKSVRNMLYKQPLNRKRHIKYVTAAKPPMMVSTSAKVVNLTWYQWSVDRKSTEGNWKVILLLICLKSSLAASRNYLLVL